MAAIKRLMKSFYGSRAWALIPFIICPLVHAEILRPVQSVEHSSLSYIRSMAFSQDGKNLYAVGSTSDSLSVFTRNADGSLTTLEAHKDNNNGIDGLAGAAHVALSPDENHVYVAASGDGDIAIFRRNADGSLNFVNATPAIGGIGLVEISPDGKNAYAVRGSFGGIAELFSRNPITGLLTYQADLSSFNGTYDTAFSNNGSFVYSVNGGELIVHQRNADGTLTTLETWSNGQDLGGGETLDGLSGAVSLAMSPDENYIYVTSASSKSVDIFSRNADGTLNYLGSVFDGDVEADSDTVSGLDGARSISTSQDGEHVYVAGRNSDSIVIFAINGDGTLDFLASLSNSDTEADGDVIQGINTVSGVLTSPDGNQVYAFGQYTSPRAVISAFDRDASGLLDFSDIFGSDIGLMGANNIVISPDNKNAYAIGGGFDAIGYSTIDGDDSVSAFTRNPDGTLEGLQALYNGDIEPDGDIIEGMTTPTDIEISPDGQFVYVVSDSSNTLMVFKRNPGGALDFLQVIKDGDTESDSDIVDGLNGAFGIGVSPDDKNVYVAGRTESKVAVFSRRPDGTLDFIERKFYGETEPDGDTLDGLFNPNDVVISSDGKFVYAGGSIINIFIRNPDGTLDYQSNHTGTDSPLIALTHDNKNLLYVDYSSNTLENYRRNNDGTLTPIQSVPGVADPSQTFISQDDRLVAVSSFANDEVLLFKRDPQTGLLTLLGNITDGTNGFESLKRPIGLTMSPDDLYLYVASTVDDAIQVCGLNFDFGDAPEAAGYPTTFTNNGARHLLSEVSGALITLGHIAGDQDTDGQPDASAEGDDTDSSSSDDEDALVSTQIFQPGGNRDLTITTPNTQTTAILNGWIDFNQNGQWEDPTEHVLTDQLTTGGTETFQVTIPPMGDGSSGTTLAGPTFMRLRINLDGNLTPTGLALDGEVEDHLVYIQADSGGVGSSSASTTDTNGETVTVSTDTGIITKLTAEPVPPGAPGGVTYGNGFFGVEISGLTPGASVTLTFTLPAGSAPDKVIKCYSSGCVDFPAFVNGDSFTVTLTDGGTGDNDGIANGVIVDPIAPTTLIPGATGATGATGPAGPSGADGTNGTDGAAGADGAVGATGATGASGTDGQNGTNGEKGSSGGSGCSVGNPDKPAIELIMLLLFSSLLLIRKRSRKSIQK